MLEVSNDCSLSAIFTSDSVAMSNQLVGGEIIHLLTQSVS